MLPAHGWTTVGLLRLCDGTGNGDVTFCLPDTPGAWMDTTFAGEAIPGSDGSPQQSYQFQVLAWLGSYTTFDAAAAANGYVGVSPVFTNAVAPPTAEPPMIPPDLVSMPAVIISHSLAGDANFDGKVDINDLTIVLTNYGQTGMAWSQGEFTGSGTVDINDLTIVLANYGQRPDSSAAGGLSAVPEPATIVLLAALLPAMAWAMRRCLRGQQRTTG
jgi:hypothetical protein